MVLKTISYLLLTSMIFHCCTSTYIVNLEQSDFDDLNENLNEKEVSIILTNQECIISQNVKVMLDTTHWIEDSTFTRNSIPTDKIREININNKDKAALYGAVSGLLIGIGLVYSPNLKEPAIVYIAMGGAIGAFVGVFLGPFIGHTDKYIINVPKSIHEE